MRRTQLLVIALLALTACSRKAGEPCTNTSQCGTGLTCCGTCTDVTTDVTHCGDCAVACGTQNGAAICQGGSCRFACQASFADCNGVPGDGCETNVQVTASACGSCTTACTYANADGECRASRCALGACRPGFADCDRLGSNGCEVNTGASAQNCGGCGVACSLPHATPRCDAAACVVASCEAGFGDCGAQPGCETDLNRSSAHCGSCATGCDGGLACVAGECRAQDLLLYGGFADLASGSAPPVDEVWRFDVSAKTFSRVVTAAGASPPARGYHSAAWDGAGTRMLVFGGGDDSSTVPSAVWALDFSAEPPAWRQLTTTGTAPAARVGAAAGWDPTGRRWFVFGGAGDLSGSSALGDLFVFEAATAQWTEVPVSGPGPRSFAAGTWDPASQRFLVFGGAPDDTSVLSDTWAFDPTSGSWQQLAATGPSARMACAFFPGPPLLFGGFDLDGLFYGDLFSLTVSPASWHDEAPTSGPPERALAATAALGGVAYLFGGFSYDSTTYQPVNHDDVWSYVASTKTWTRLRASGAAGAPGSSGGVSLVGRE